MDRLREEISKNMGWWSPDGHDAYPEKTDKVLTLIQSEVTKGKIEELKRIQDDKNSLEDKYYIEKRINQLEKDKEKS